VDDDPAVRDILGALLRRDGWHIDTAADGLQAIASLDQSAYSVVMLDLLLPGLDGVGVIEHMKARHIETPVVVITGAADHRLLDPQIVVVTLQKPIEIGDLRTVLRAITESGKP
jgi:DNA-binding NtrC family response regulator